MINNGTLEELAIYFFLIVFLLFPFAYIHFKNGNNKFLFLSACVGATLVILLSLYIFALPFGIFMVKIVPQLAQHGQIDYILPLLKVAEFFQRYYLVLFYPLLHLLMPSLIFRRYSIFKKVKEI